jgi:apoptosis-inducing factor 3
MAEHQIDLASQPMRDGEMRRLELEGKGVVLAHVEGQYYAFRAGCTHYGGPLNEGVLKSHTIMCPWHHACFDIRNGSRMEPPALNNLPTYTVRTEGQQVFVALESPSQPVAENQPDNRHFVIIGGGAGGNAAAEALRRVGFQGKVTIISAVPEVPIDRPNLSKDYLDGHAKSEWMPLRDKNWYEQRNIELLLNTKVVAINPQSHSITLADNNSIQYDKLLLATGGTPRRLNVAGMDLANVFTLRSQSDADAIIAATKEGQRAVIIGASFIGMEVAASLVGGYKTNVTVVAPEPTPFAPIFGDKIGQLFRKEHEANGVNFKLQSEVAQIVGANGQVSSVQLKNGETIPADFVVVGVGVSPATDFLKSAGLTLYERDSSVRVNAHLQSSNPDIYAAGDIARWDNGSPDGQRIEHWRVAQQHGIVAAHNMAGQQENINDHIPFFWTKQWDINLRSVGFAKDWDEIIYRGDVEAKNFIAFYVKNNQLQAAVSCKRDAETCAVEFILRDKMPLTREQMANADFDLIAYATGQNS